MMVTPLLVPSRFAPASIILRASPAVRIPPEALTPMVTARRISATSSTVATPPRKPSRSLHEIGAGLFADLAGREFFVLRQQAHVQDDFEQGFPRVDGFGHGAYVREHEIAVAGFQRADIHDHVYFARALFHRFLSLEYFDACRRRAQRKSDDGAHLHAAALQIRNSEGHAAGIHHHIAEGKFAGFLAKTHNLIGCGFRAQERVVNDGGEFLPGANRRFLVRG